MNYSQFSIWDVFVNIIPGATVLFLFMSLLPSEYLLRIVAVSAAFGIGGAFFAVVLSFVVGWVFQSFARVVDGVIVRHLSSHGNLWSDEVEGCVDDSDELSFNEQYVRGARLFFADESAEKYEELNNELDEKLLKHLTYSYLYDNDVGRSHRFYILMVLSRSLYTMFGITAIGQVLGQVGACLGVYTPTLGVYEATTFSIVLALGTVLMFDTRKYMEKSRIKTMISDFYVSELAE